MLDPVVTPPALSPENKLRSAKVLVRSPGMHCWAIFDPEGISSMNDAFWFALRCVGEQEEVIEVRCSLLFAEVMRYREIGARLRSLENVVPVSDGFAKLRVDPRLEGVVWTIKTKEGTEFEYWMRGREKYIRVTPDCFKGNLQQIEGE